MNYNNSTNQNSKRKTQTKLNYQPLQKRTRKETPTLKSPSTGKRAIPNSTGSNQTARALSQGPVFKKPRLNMSLRSSGARKKQIKKIQINLRPLKKTISGTYQEEAWAKLQLAIRAVHGKTSVNESEEELYKLTENICAEKFGASLYQRIKTELESHLKSIQQKLIDQTDEFFLQNMHLVWDDHCQQMLFIRSIVLPLDRTYAVPTPAVLSIWDLGLNLFRNLIASQSELQKKTLGGLLDLIQRERNGQVADRVLLKSMIEMYSSLQIYRSVFEPGFLIAAEKYYTQDGKNAIDSLQISDYLLHVQSRISQEEERIAHYMMPSTRRNLLSILDEQLLGPHVDTIINRGFSKLMTGKRLEDLRRMYRLLSRVQALGPLTQALLEYTTKTASSLVKTSTSDTDKDLVQRLLELRTDLLSLWEAGFNKNTAMASAIRKAFEVSVNLDRRTPVAELIAKYIDMQLRSGNKKVSSESELEDVLDEVLQLFKHIDGKDIFCAFYKKDLSKRLLLNKSQSIDAEKNMIIKLKAECGAGFTNKLEGMFKDMNLSRDLMMSFRETKVYKSLMNNQEKTNDLTQQKKCKIQMDMNVYVLTMGFWPAYAPVEVNLPPQLALYQETFKTFYLSKYNGRRLFWQNSLGGTVLKAQFPKGTKELQVSLFQSVVLLLFNHADSLQYSDIHAALNLEHGELKRTLQSLALGRVRVLRKRPKGKEVNETDKFFFNIALKHKLYRIKINSIQMKETPEENKKTKENVFQDRQYQIDAAIVRIMKTRKQLEHRTLMSELYKQLRFPVDASDVKKRIGSLIDREYLERDKSSQTLYNYLA